MDFRNRKSTNKANIKFVKVSEVKGSAQINDGAMWLKSGKYAAPSVSIKVSPEVTLSDWVRKITLRNVDVTVEETENGHSNLVISGRTEACDKGELPF